VSPSDGGSSGRKARIDCLEAWNSNRGNYDNSFHFGQTPKYVRGGKIARNLKACGLPANTDPSLELFISEAAETTAKEFITSNYPEGFIFCHTESERHPNHNWDASVFLDTLPRLPTFRPDETAWGDINVTFALARAANHRVLISSVFVHACDAMGSRMDLVHYGVPNPHGLPLDENIILNTDGAH